jgi:hypothetical protein
MSVTSIGPAHPLPRSRVTRGRLIRIAIEDPAQATLEFQYNPETVTRTRTGQWTPRKRRRDPHAPQTPQQKSQLGAAGAAGLLAEAETISFQLVFDATEALLATAGAAGAASGEGADPVRDGVLPQLAFLEMVTLGMPPQARTGADARTDKGIKPVRPDELLLQLGDSRTFPCILTDLTITEQRFGPALVPVRARADLKFTVLESVEVPNNPRVGTAFDTLLADRRRLAGQAGTQALSLDRIFGGGTP